jgi:hypothetical protein
VRRQGPPVGQHTQQGKQVGPTLDLVENDQPPEALESQERLGEARFVAGVLEVEVGRPSPLSDATRERRLAALPRPEDRHQRAPPQGLLDPSSQLRAGDQPHPRILNSVRSVFKDQPAPQRLQRPWPKGRDYYDLVWYLSDRDWPAPNLVLPNNALAQTGWTCPALTGASWVEAVRARLRSVKWEGLAADVSPLLESPEDRALLTRQTVVRLLDERAPEHVRQRRPKRAT